MNAKSILLPITSLLLALGSGFGASAAVPSGIFPNPQQETVGGTAYASASASYRLVGADAADPIAVKALQAKLSPSASGSIEIRIGEVDDAAVAAVKDLVPANPQAYYLKVEPGKVTIAGRDELGTYYGAQSFLQLAAKAQVPAVEVKDWPTTKVRGVIEGYYGNPWSHEDCIDMCTFFDQNKMNTFIYGPKNDSYHHGGGVFTPYPADQAANLAALVREANNHHVDIVWAMHPGNSNDGDNLQKAVSKLNAMYDLGFRRFAVFFDDISANSVQKQIDFLNHLNKNVVKAKGDVKGLIVCPSEYCISFAGGQNTSSTYLNSLGAGLDADIDIMWTGWQVVDMELEPSCNWFINRTGRKPFIWHNYPCSDYGSRPLLLCPYEPATKTLYTKITGFTANPMEYYEASKVGLYGMADFAWNPEAYDPWQAWEEAVQFIMPEHADAFRTYCYSNFNYPAPKSHGKPIIYTETPDFKALLDSKSFGSATASDYAAYFQTQLDAAVELRAIKNNRLVTELAEWLEYYELQSRRGLDLVAMRQAIDAKDGEAFINTYKEYVARTAQGEALRSRSYAGSLRTLTPFCGSQFVEPFIGNTVEYLITDFKALGLDYPAGLFPARMIENGNYVILYKGKYLTNRNGSTQPTFTSEVDNINPNRQVWTIRYVPETGRYSLISAEDNRYVNELGVFGTNAYSDAWNTYDITCLGGLYAFQNGGSSGTNFWEVKTNKIQKATSNAYNPANFIFQIIPAGQPIPDAPASAWTDGEYVIKDTQGNYLTRVSNEVRFNKPTTSDTGNKIKATQKWTITKDAETNRFKITQGASYINEKPVIGTNQYYASWNSYRLFEYQGKHAIGNADDAGTNFWTITPNGLTNHGCPLMDAFEFSIVTVESELSSAIDQVESVANDGAAAIYDLQGRRVARPGHGLYIRQGKIVRL